MHATQKKKVSRRTKQTPFFSLLFINLLPASQLALTYLPSLRPYLHVGAQDTKQKQIVSRSNNKRQPSFFSFARTWRSNIKNDE